MEEIKFEVGQDLNSIDKMYLEYIINRSKKYGIQTGVTWSEDVYSYLFENNAGIVDLTGVLGIDLISEEI